MLISDPYIDQAVVYGDGRQFISAMIIPSQENLQQQAEYSGWSIEIVDEFIQTPAIHEFFETRIEEVMQAVSPPERVKKFLLMGRALQVDADELTATLKVRRRHIIAKYETQLSALYEN